MFHRGMMSIDLNNNIRCNIDINSNPFFKTTDSVDEVADSNLSVVVEGYQ